MRTFIYTFLLTTIVFVMSSCHKNTNYGPTLEEVVTEYDIWYVDYNSTTGYGNVPMLSKAFTISFDRGRVFANNNIVGIGFTGDGYGIQIGTYDTRDGYLNVSHDIDGFYSFDVIADSPRKIRLYDEVENVTYYLQGYDIDEFDFDSVFYANIEYFLQEYFAWEKTYTSSEGDPNMFDDENYLAFTPENTTTFYSSQDEPGIALDDIYWDFTGSYEVFDVNGNDNLKIVKLFYDTSDYEEFELVVLDDKTIELYHVTSGTTYEFAGRDFIQFKKPETSGRERTKVIRKSIDRNPLAIQNKG